MVGIAIVAGAGFVLVLLLLLLFKAFYRTPSANQALIITGLGGSQEKFKIVRGSGSLVLPIFQQVGRLSLSAEQTVINVDGVDAQKIPIGVTGSVVFKVGNDDQSITNAALRFMGDQAERGADVSEMHKLVQNVLHGHLRSIMGGLTVEDLIANRNRLADETRSAVREELEAMGLVIDSLQIQDIKDPSGYILSLGQPREAEVKMNARIAAASRDREATEREQEAEALKNAARKDAEVKRSAYQAEIDRQTAATAQAGPLAEAEARQEVVKRETQIAELEAEREQRRLVTMVQRPAEANAEAVRIRAQADRDAAVALAQAEAQTSTLRGEASASVARQTGLADAEAIRARGEAEGASVRAKGLAEADAIAKRAEALERESDAVIGQTIAESLPDVVRAAASAFEHVEHMIVLNGAQGVTEALGQIIAQGGALAGMARATLRNGNGNGTTTYSRETTPVPSEAEAQS